MFVSRHVCLLLLISFCGLFQSIAYADARRDAPFHPQVEFIEDASRLLTIDDIKTESRSWQAIQSKEPNFGFTESAIWLKINLADLPNAQTSKILELAYPLMDSVEFYLPVNGHYQYRLMGDRFRFSDRSISHPNFVIRLNEHIDTRQPLYMRVSSRDSVIAPLKVWQEEAFFVQSKTRNYLIGAYYGAIGSIILYSLICWIVLKTNVFLLNIALVTGFCLTQLSLDGSGSMLFWGDYPEFAKRIRPFAISMLAIGSVELTKSYFQRKILVPAIPALYTGIRVFGLVGMIGALYLPFSVAIQLSMVTLVAAVVPILITGVKELKAGSLMGRYFVIGWFILIIGGIANVLRAFGILPVNMFTVYGAQFGALATMLLLTFGFTDRIRVLSRRVELANAEILAKEIKAKQELEEKVEQRTLDLAKSNEVISQKNEAFKILVETNSLMDHERSLQALLEITVAQLAKVFPHNQIALILSDEIINESVRPIYHGIPIDKQKQLQQLASVLIQGESSEKQSARSKASAAFSESLSVVPIKRDKNVLFGHAFMIGKALDVSDEELIGVFVDQLNSFLKNKNLHDQLELIANKDTLTGVFSRAYFDRHFAERVKEQAEAGTHFAVVLVDVNGLKYVNDNHGHNDGDRLLICVARFLSEHVRGNDIVCRLGGDEFVIVAQGDQAKAEQLAHKLSKLQHRLKLEVGPGDEPEEVAVRFSIGVASSSDHACEDLLKIADEQMYVNKRAFYEAQEN